MCIRDSSGIDKSGYGYEDYNVFTGDAAPGTQAAQDTVLDGYKYIRIEPTGVANVKTLTELQAAAQNQYISLINVMNDITITDTVYVLSLIHILTELLRDRTGEQPGIPEAMKKVTEVYEMTIEEIKKGM